LNKKKKI